MPPRSLSLTCGVLRGRRLHPIFGVIARPAWETIAEPTFPRSLPSFAYLNLGYIRRLTDSGIDVMSRYQFTWYLLTDTSLPLPEKVTVPSLAVVYT